MATYQHGVYNQEQATSLTTPIRSSAALQVIFGTAPVHLADDPTKAANTLKLCTVLRSARPLWAIPTISKTSLFARALTPISGCSITPPLFW